ncbi:MAG: hypothetical protein DME02_17290 [Candidatus Rokuibacteriota bacterium]|nr:MAG: hypothetical protein DME02_17290 [Candidatus Rokubacteria bacterium]
MDVTRIRVSPRSSMTKSQTASNGSTRRRCAMSPNVCPASSGSRGATATRTASHDGMRPKLLSPSRAISPRSRVRTSGRRNRSSIEPIPPSITHRGNRLRSGLLAVSYG